MVPVMNGGPVEMLNTTVTITTSTAGVSLKGGGTIRIPRIAPFTSADAEIEIEVDRSFTGIGQLQLNVTVSNEDACQPIVTRPLFAWINVRRRARHVERRHSGEPVIAVDDDWRQRRRHLVPRRGDAVEPRLVRPRLQRGVGHGARVAGAERRQRALRDLIRSPVRL